MGVACSRAVGVARTPSPVVALAELPPSSSASFRVCRDYAHRRAALIKSHEGDSAPTASDGPFEVVRQLGSGSGGTVLLVRCRHSGFHFAMKTLSRDSLNVDRHNELCVEVELLTAVDHPSIVALAEYYITSESVFLLMQALSGGELYDALQQQPGGHFGEEHASYLVRQMVSSIAYLHSVGIVHRDLKLENWIFSQTSKRDLRLIDLGLSHRFAFDGNATSGGLHSVVGTPYYVAPEVIAAVDPSAPGYDAAVDSWSLGVLTYMLLSGIPPFRGRRDHEVLDAVRRGRYTLSGPRWAHVSEEGKSFVRALLQWHPSARMSASEALHHPWLSGAWHTLEARPLPLAVIHRLRHFATLARWKRATLGAVAFVTAVDMRDENVIELLRDAFERLSDVAGVIRRSSFVDALNEDAGISQEDASDLFDGVLTDTEAAGISYSSWLAATLPRSITDERSHLSEAFRALDLDHRGYLTVASFKEVEVRLGCVSEDDLEALFSTAGCDGKLSFEGFIAALVEDSSTDRLPSPRLPERGLLPWDEEPPLTPIQPDAAAQPATVCEPEAAEGGAE